MNSYRITGKAGTSHWIPARELASAEYELLRRYNAAARRRRLPEIGRCPGTVASDIPETRNNRVVAIHGGRPGHGYVTIRIRWES